MMGIITDYCKKMPRVFISTKDADAGIIHRIYS